MRAAARARWAQAQTHLAHPVGALGRYGHGFGATTEDVFGHRPELVRLNLAVAVNVEQSDDLEAQHLPRKGSHERLGLA
jgi:hypothetical protein